MYIIGKNGEIKIHESFDKQAFNTIYHNEFIRHYIEI